MDKRRQSILKQEGRMPLQEMLLPDFPDDDTATTTVTKSRRVSFGANFVKEFIVGSAVSTQFFSEYEQAFSSSDSSNPNSSRSGILDQSTFLNEDALNLCVKPKVDVDYLPVRKKFCPDKQNNACNENNERMKDKNWDFNVGNTSNIFMEKSNNVGKPIRTNEESMRNTAKCPKKAMHINDSFLIGEKQMRNRHNDSELNSSKINESTDKKCKQGKFSSTICFSADSPTADMEFTEGCISLAKSILDKKKKEMTVYIQAKTKENPEDQSVPKDVLFDGSGVEMSLTKCVHDDSEVDSFEENENGFPFPPPLNVSNDLDDSIEESENVPKHIYPLDVLHGCLNPEEEAGIEKSLYCSKLSLTEMLNSHSQRTSGSEEFSLDDNEECDMEISSCEPSKIYTYEEAHKDSEVGIPSYSEKEMSLCDSGNFENNSEKINLEISYDSLKVSAVDKVEKEEENPVLEDMNKNDGGKMSMTSFLGLEANNENFEELEKGKSGNEPVGLKQCNQVGGNFEDSFLMKNEILHSPTIHVNMKFKEEASIESDMNSLANEQPVNLLSEQDHQEEEKLEGEISSSPLLRTFIIDKNTNEDCDTREENNDTLEEPKNISRTEDDEEEKILTGTLPEETKMAEVEPVSGKEDNPLVDVSLESQRIHEGLQMETKNSCYTENLTMEESRSEDCPMDITDCETLDRMSQTKTLHNEGEEEEEEGREEDDDKMTIEENKMKTPEKDSFLNFSSNEDEQEMAEGITKAFSQGSISEVMEPAECFAPEMEEGSNEGTRTETQVEEHSEMSLSTSGILFKEEKKDEGCDVEMSKSLSGALQADGIIREEHEDVEEPKSQKNDHSEMSLSTSGIPFGQENKDEGCDVEMPMSLSGVLQMDDIMREETKSQKNDHSEISLSASGILFKEDKKNEDCNVEMSKGLSGALQADGIIREEHEDVEEPKSQKNDHSEMSLSTSGIPFGQENKDEGCDVEMPMSLSGALQADGIIREEHEDVEEPKSQKNDHSEMSLSTSGIPFGQENKDEGCDVEMSKSLSGALQADDIMREEHENVEEHKPQKNDHSEISLSASGNLFKEDKKNEDCNVEMSMSLSGALQTDGIMREEHEDVEEHKPQKNDHSEISLSTSGIPFGQENDEDEGCDVEMSMSFSDVLKADDITREGHEEVIAESRMDLTSEDLQNLPIGQEENTSTIRSEDSTNFNPRSRKRSDAECEGNNKNGRGDENGIINESKNRRDNCVSKGDKKIMSMLTEQEQEINSTWKIDSFTQDEGSHSWSFSFLLLGNPSIMKFKLVPPVEMSIISFSSISEGSISLLEPKKYQSQNEKLVIDFGFKKVKNYFVGESRSVDNVHKVPLFLDRMNVFLIRINNVLNQFLRIMKEYPGSTLTKSVLSFRLYSFPLMFSLAIMVDVSDPLKISESSISFEKHFGSFSPAKIKSVFASCLTREEAFVEFIRTLVQLVIKEELEFGCVTNRSHIRLIV